MMKKITVLNLVILESCVLISLEISGMGENAVHSKHPEKLRKIAISQISPHDR